MKLLARVLDRIERRREGKRGVRAKAWGLVWSESEALLDRLPGPGEYVARDITVIGDPVRLRAVAGTRGLGPPYCRTSERFTPDPLDKGKVLLEDGSEVGVVLGGSGGMIDFRWHAGLSFFENAVTSADADDAGGPASPAAGA